MRASISIEYLPAKVDHTTPKLEAIGVMECTPYHMTIQTEFDKPNQVDYEDLIKISFLSPKYFVSEATG